MTVTNTRQVGGPILKETKFMKNEHDPEHDDEDHVDEDGSRRDDSDLEENERIDRSYGFLWD